LPASGVGPAFGPSAGRGKRRAPAAPPAGRERFSCDAGARDYVLHLPENTETPRGLVLMLHGCTQTPEDFARGTAMNARADAAGMIVVWPAQARGDNAQSCWNWFSGADQQRDRGEPAILAGLARDVAARHGVPGGAVFAAGLSAGAAMAVILGQTYPEVFAGVGAHSGLPHGCARGVTEAFAAMAGQGAARRPGAAARPVPTIVFHGARDTTVNPANAAQIIADTLGASPGPQVQTVKTGSAGGRRYRRTTSLDAQGNLLADDWRIDGLGHAWSGGNPQGSYADACGPDASAEMLGFFAALGTLAGAGG
jgi:poly(hydroxyalkanoate) depolymerase family esterase